MQDDFNFNGNSKTREDAYSSGDKSKRPNLYGVNSKGGIWDLTNPFQFAPYETGYCFLAVISAPICMTKGPKAAFHKALQESFVNMLESEFKGLDGIEDITSETMDITNNMSTISMISKVNQQSNGQITMRFTEKTGSLITKYCSEYLKTIRDPRSQAKRYVKDDASVRKNMFAHEVFHMLYIVTDASCFTVEKAFLLLNMQPTTASYGELYNFERGDIGVKELTIPFNAFVVDGKIANTIAESYMKALVNTGDPTPGKINLNSNNFNWSISNSQGTVNTIDQLTKK